MSAKRNVHVFSADQTEDLGIGVHLGETTLRKEVESGAMEGPLEGLLLAFADLETPKIQLASGEIIYGSMCWWIDVPPKHD